MKTIEMTNYSVSQKGYPDLAKVCRQYNYKNVVVIGGKRALKSVSEKIKEALKDTEINITNEFVYGDECTMTNINNLSDKKDVQDADVIFIVGGGKAMDTGKILADKMNKGVFSFPTICSNCAAATAIAVVYNDDKTLSHYALIPAPSHMFIEVSVIAQAPSEYIWAGIGDGLSKQVEVEFATRNLELDHTASMGLSLSKSCQEPFLKYGKQAIEDCNNNIATDAIKEIALNILVSTGYVSNLTNQPEYYYNSSIAHIFYNTSTSIKREENCLHGALVAFGVMVLHAYAENYDELEKIAVFNKSVGLPITLEEVGLSEKDLVNMAEVAPNTTEWKSSVEGLSKEKFIEAIKEADKYGRDIKKIEKCA